MARPFAAARRLAPVLVALLAAHVAGAWLALAAVLVYVELVWHAAVGRFDVRGLLAAHVVQFEALRALQAALWAATAAAFVLWLRRVDADLPAVAGPHVGYASRRTVSALLLPLAGVVGPARTLARAWRVGDTRASGARVPARIAWWRGLVLAAALAEGTAWVFGLHAGTPLGLGWSTRAAVVAALLTIPAAVLGIAVVLGLDGRLEEAGRAPRGAASAG
jgi:hypothetical protein